jgi:uncharacterized UBP type Zn finger protein
MSLMNQWLQGVVEHSLQLNKHSDSDFPYEEVIKSDKQTSEVKLNPEKLMASARSLRAIINHPGDKVDEPHAGDFINYGCAHVLSRMLNFAPGKILSHERQT